MDAKEIVERLRAKASYTDKWFNNSSLGEMYREAADFILAQQAEIARLREALEPFAVIGEYDGEWLDRVKQLTTGDFLRARHALQEPNQ